MRLSPPGEHLTEWTLALVPRVMARLDVLARGDAADVFSDPLALTDPTCGDLVVTQQQCLSVGLRRTATATPAKPLQQLTDERRAAARQPSEAALTHTQRCFLDARGRSQLVPIESPQFTRAPENGLDISANSTTTETSDVSSRRCSRDSSRVLDFSFAPRGEEGGSRLSRTAERPSPPPKRGEGASRLYKTAERASSPPKRSRGHVRTMSDPHSPQSVDGLFAKLQVRRTVMLPLPAAALGHTPSPLVSPSVRLVCTRPCDVCMRDVKEEHTLVLVLSAFLRAKDEFDQRERSEFPQ